MKDMERDEVRYQEAKQLIKKRKRFYIHLFIFSAVNILLYLHRQSGDTNVEIHPYLTLVVWGLFLLLDACRTFVPWWLFGERWEEKKIRELMNKNK